MMTSPRFPDCLLSLRMAGVCAGLVIALGASGADESAPVPKPEVKEGDIWGYLFTNFVTNVPKTARLETRVTFANADAIVTVDKVGNGPENDSQYTAEWNGISLSSGAVNDRPARLYKFPLTVGETYPYSWETTWRGRSSRSRNEGMVKVVGWEDVVVPAGKFRAIKIEARGAYQRLDVRYGAPQRWDIWYVPEIRRGVKLLYEDGQPGRDPDTRRLFELMDFKLQ